MKINTNEELKALDGETVLTDRSGDNTTLGNVISNSLIMHKSNDKMKCYSLAQRIHDNAEVDVDDSDLALIREAINRAEAGYTNIAAGQALVMLNKK